MNDFLSLRIEAILFETADSKTFIFKSIHNEIISYQAGQFLTFLIDHNGHEIRRSYSLSSSPDTDSQLAVTIKRVANGEISRYLLDTWKVGDIVQSLYPAGRFAIKTNSGLRRDIVLIGAGSGITPLFSLLKTILIQEPLSHVTLIYANHNADATIFKNALELLAQKYASQFRCIYLWASVEKINGDEPISGSLEYNRGIRLTNALLERLITKNLRFKREDALFYLCGPVPIMRMAQITLRFMGFQNHQIRQEYFIVTPLSTKEDNVITTSEISAWVKIHYRMREVDLEVPAYENILQAALKNGIALPYSCRVGRCSTCIARCTMGKVRMSINEVLTEKDLEEGWILTCTSYPETSEVELVFE